MLSTRASLATRANRVRSRARRHQGQQLAETAGRSQLGLPAPRLVLTTIDGAKSIWVEHTYEEAGPDLAVIAVNIGFNDTLADVQACRRNMHSEMPIVINDGRLADALHLRVTPQHIVIGRDGRVLYVGHLADSRLDDALTAASTLVVPVPAAQMTPSVAEAPPAHLQVGDLSPDESRRTLTGTSFTLRDPQRSRITVLVFIRRGVRTISRRFGPQPQPFGTKSLA